MNNKFMKCHEKSIEMNYKSDAFININNYSGKVLLISEEQDPYWPSKNMSAQLTESSIDKNKVKHITLDLNAHRYLNFPESTAEILKFINNNI